MCRYTQFAQNENSSFTRMKYLLLWSTEESHEGLEVSIWWQNDDFCMNYLFKSCGFSPIYCIESVFCISLHVDIFFSKKSELLHVASLCILFIICMFWSINFPLFWGGKKPHAMKDNHFLKSKLVMLRNRFTDHFHYIFC